MLKIKKNKCLLFVVCDVYCLVVIEQFCVLVEQIDVLMYLEIDSKDLVFIVQNVIKEVCVKGYDLVIVDMVGCLVVDEQMMNEIVVIKEVIQFNEILFVVDFMIG